MTVTVCAVPQFAVVNVSVVAGLVRTWTASELSVMVTTSEGGEFKTTVYVSLVAPVSATSVEAPDSTINTPALSVMMATTSAIVMAAPL